MDIFIFIMMLVMLGTITSWHLYSNIDTREYFRVRRLFMRVISAEFFLVVLVLILAMIFGE